MAFHLIGTDPFTSTFVLDSEEDAAELPPTAVSALRRSAPRARTEAESGA